MINESSIRHCPPAALSVARANCHRATQLLSLAARANRAAREDDSHASLVWDARHNQFLTLPLSGASGDFHVALTLAHSNGDGLSLVLLQQREVQKKISLGEMSYQAALDWLDEQLVAHGLQACTHVALPYALPVDVAAIERFDSQVSTDTWLALAGWFGTAFIVLTELAERSAGHKPGVGPIWVWPHHFDMASYIPLTDCTDERAPGIGVGFSPGDTSYAQPYLYVNPWPAPGTEELPEAPAPGHWHVSGFVGLVATADELLAGESVISVGQTFTNQAVTVSRRLLGA